MSQQPSIAYVVVFTSNRSFYPTSVPSDGRLRVFYAIVFYIVPPGYHCILPVCIPYEAPGARTSGIIVYCCTGIIYKRTIKIAYRIRVRSYEYILSISDHVRL